MATEYQTTMSNPEKLKIAIIDDDIAPIGFAKLSEPLQNILGDPNSPQFQEIWAFAAKYGHIANNEEEDEEGKVVISTSNDFVQNVILAPEFETELAELYEELVSTEKENYQANLNWLNEIRPIFADENYEVTEFIKHPEPEQLVGYYGIVLDLLVNVDADGFNQATTLIENIFTACDEENTEPPMVVIVSRLGEILDSKRMEFRARTDISASLLRLIPKIMLKPEASGEHRFRLLWEQMKDERSYAFKLNQFGKTIRDSIENVSGELMRLIWNLDCDAFFRLYETCLSEGDNFDERMLEFISRSFVWQLYGIDDIKLAIQSICSVFAERYDNDTGEGPKSFFSLSDADTRAIQTLTHQYYWLPIRPRCELKKIKFDTFAKQPSLYLPFGAVLRNRLASGEQQLLVHITQQCNLIRISESNEYQSYSFVVGLLSKPDNLSSRFLSISGYEDDEKEYKTIYIDHSKLISLPVDEIFEYIKQNQFEIDGQIRLDVAQTVLNSQLNYLSRPAFPGITNVDIERIHIRVVVNKQEHYLSDSESVRNKFSVRISRPLSLKPKERQISFIGDDPQNISIQCQQQFPDLSSDFLALASILNDGLIQNDSQPILILDKFRIYPLMERDPETVKKILKENPPKGQIGIYLIPVQQ